jgi:hypothetical protein
MEIANLRSAATTTSALFALDPEAARALRPYFSDPEIIPCVFELLGETEGEFRASEIMNPRPVDPELDPYLRSFLAQVAENSAFGAGDEDLSLLPAIQETELAGDPLQLFTYNSLRALTMSSVVHRGLLQSLLAKLDAAEAAAARGNTRSKTGHLRAYANELAAQSGKKVDQGAAEVLLSLIETL